MLRYLMKDKGSNYHVKITGEEFEQAKKELDDFDKNSEDVSHLYSVLKGLIAQYAEHLSWFDINALRNADSKNIGKFMYLLARPYEIKLEKEGLIEKYGFEKDLNPTKKQEKKFEKFFNKKDMVGTRVFYAWGGDWTVIFSQGLQFARLLLGPFCFIAARIPFVALGFFITWVFAAMFDWVVLGIPYLIFKGMSGLPGDYYNSDIIISPYLLGDTTNAKDELREIVKADKANADAYESGL